MDSNPDMNGLLEVLKNTQKQSVLDTLIAEAQAIKTQTQAVQGRATKLEDILLELRSHQSQALADQVVEKATHQN